MKFGCCIQNVEDIVRLRDAGYDFFEFAGFRAAEMSDQEFNHLVETVESLGFPCLGFNSYCSGTPAIVGPDFHLEEISDYAKRLCLRGKQLDIRSIGIGAPLARRLPASFSRDRAWEQCRQFLRATHAEAEKCGIQVLFEAVNNKACNFITCTKDASKIVHELDIPGLGLVLDFFHMSVMNEALGEAKAALPFLRHVHISTCGPQLQRGFPGISDRSYYEKIFLWLKVNHYEDTISIEADHFDFEAAVSSIKMLHDVDVQTNL